jgi:UDP-N-acetylglucosamine 2-epimerase (non-hydrolysing)
MPALRKILVVFGTRPEAVKLAPVIDALRPRLEVRICVTAQHRALLDQMLGAFGIAPDHDLDLMLPGQEPFDVVRGVLEGVRAIAEREQPDALLVQGDTSTAFAAALAAAYLGIPVAHVEAGLRTGDPAQPFPEEINRRLTTHLARWHFAPTPTARDNLLREGVAPESIFVTGNPVVDALQALVRRLDAGDVAPVHCEPALRAFDATRLLLVTAHRRENLGRGIANICRALADVATRRPETAILFPVHPNPGVRASVEKLLGNSRGVHLCAPMDYLAFVDAMRRADLVLTDSGGVQEEAPSLGRRVLVLREKTERPEGVAAGHARLVGTEWKRIVAEVESSLAEPPRPDAAVIGANPYGDGKAAERIASALTRALD